MRVVIAGGTGIMGRALAPRLVKDLHEVIVLSRNPTAAKSAHDDDVRYVRWNTSDLGSWSEEVDGADIVINFAGDNLAGDRFLPRRWTGAKKQILRNSRLETGAAIARAIDNAKVKPRALIQASAVGYYGPRGTEIISEIDTAGDDFLAKLCVEWEESTSQVEEQEVRRVILRTGIVLTTKGGPLPRLLKQFQLFAGGSFGGGHQYWPWIHLEDVAEAIRFLVENEKAEGPFNLTAPTPVTNKQFTLELGRVLRRPSFWPIPAIAMKLLVGEVSIIVLEGQRAIPAKLTDLGYEFKYAELDYALEDLLS
jgi:uncharacterized protein (TIGR01777 family)